MLKIYILKYVYLCIFLLSEREKSFWYNLPLSENLKICILNILVSDCKKRAHENETFFFIFHEFL